MRCWTHAAGRGLSSATSPVGYQAPARRTTAVPTRLQATTHPAPGEHPPTSALECQEDECVRSCQRAQRGSQRIISLWLIHHIGCCDDIEAAPAAAEAAAAAADDAAADSGCCCCGCLPWGCRLGQRGGSGRGSRRGQAAVWWRSVWLLLSSSLQLWWRHQGRRQQRCRCIALAPHVGKHSPAVQAGSEVGLQSVWQAPCSVLRQHCGQREQRWAAWSALGSASRAAPKLGTRAHCSSGRPTGTGADLRVCIGQRHNVRLVAQCDLGARQGQQDAHQACGRTSWELVGQHSLVNTRSGSQRPPGRAGCLPSLWQDE